MKNLYEIIKKGEEISSGEAASIAVAISGINTQLAAEMCEKILECQKYIHEKEYLSAIMIDSNGRAFHAVHDSQKAASRRNIMAEIRRAAQRKERGAKRYQRAKNKLYEELTEAQGLGLEIRQRRGGIACLYLTRDGKRATPGTIYRSNRRSDTSEDFATTPEGTHKDNAMAEALKLYKQTKFK